MNKKMIYIIVAVIVVVLVVGVAGIMLLNNNGNNGNTNPTPTPTPSTVVGASTVQFNVNDTGVVYTFSAKNFNTSTVVVRVDMDLGTAGNYSYILDANQAKSWISTNGGAFTASDFTADWTTYGTMYNGFVDKIVAKGSTADFTDGTATFYCIAANPTLADSLFATS